MARECCLLSVYYDLLGIHFELLGINRCLGDCTGRLVVGDRTDYRRCQFQGSELCFEDVKLTQCLTVPPLVEAPLSAFIPRNPPLGLCRVHQRPHGGFWVWRTTGPTSDYSPQTGDNRFRAGIRTGCETVITPTPRIGKLVFDVFDDRHLPFVREGLEGEAVPGHRVEPVVNFGDVRLGPLVLGVRGVDGRDRVTARRWIL
jgi:hypothetical protein